MLVAVLGDGDVVHWGQPSYTAVAASLILDSFSSISSSGGGRRTASRTIDKSVGFATTSETVAHVLLFEES